ncbi:MAG: hypothetical protein PHD19_11605 [Dechloromonas sp.]|nr:hypothetical protein [Dechloromonas sp.]
MPEKMLSWWQSLIDTAAFVAMGMFIGVGQLLASKEVLTLRIIIGRALSTGGIAAAAGAALVWVPDLPRVGQLGIAAALASLGTSGLERLFQRLLQGRG